MFIDLGKQLHRRTLEQCHVEKLEAVRTAEEAIRAKAENQKQEALKQLLKKTQQEHEKVVQKLRKEHRKAIQVNITLGNLDYLKRRVLLQLVGVKMNRPLYGD